MDVNPFQVYQTWPEEAIWQALEDFKREMYDGAGSDELRAGLLCFDFLITRSDLSHNLEMMLEAAINEARMRIELMDAHDAALADQVETDKKIDKVMASLENMVRTMRGIVQRGRQMDPDIVREHVRKQIAWREQNGY